MCTVVHLEPEDFARELVHNQKNVYALHAEIYRKVNLDNRLRERQKNPSC